jgi:hypothetical protein
MIRSLDLGQIRRAAIAAAIMSAALMASADPGPQGPSSASSPASAAAGRPRAKLVYAWDANLDAGPEWSEANVDITPKGQRKFLGRFRNKTVSLSLDDIPPHKMLRVSFDLFVIMTWDGSTDPDIWSLSVAGGPCLIRTTFDNGASKNQAFPGEYPDDLSDGAAGAAEKESLGYGQLGPVLGMGDEVYKLSFTFPHSRKSVRLDFKGDLKDDGNDETWGLANVRVEAIDRPRPVSEKELDNLWNVMADADPAVSHAAGWRLIGAGEEARRFLAGKAAVHEVDANEIASLMRDLDADEWKDREAATKALARAGIAARPLLMDALENAKSEEMRTRLKFVLEELRKQNSPQSRRALRALDILSWESSRPDKRAAAPPASMPASQPGPSRPSKVLLESH